MGNLEEIETDVRRASLRQIDAAIDHLRKSEFEAAISLASAAEGISPATDKPHLFKTLKTWGYRFHQISGVRQVSTILLIGLSTAKMTRAPKRRKISELEVITTISRAISKFAAVYDGLSPQMAAFRDWAIARIQASTEGVLLPSALSGNYPSTGTDRIRAAHRALPTSARPFGSRLVPSYPRPWRCAVH